MYFLLTKAHVYTNKTRKSALILSCVHSTKAVAQLRGLLYMYINPVSSDLHTNMSVRISPITYHTKCLSHNINCEDDSARQM